MAEDYFVVLTSISEQQLATKTCEALEEAGIPVLLEHREIVDGPRKATGYRVFVPAQFRQSAMRLASAASSSFLFKTSERIH